MEIIKIIFFCYIIICSTLFAYLLFVNRKLIIIWNTLIPTVASGLVGLTLTLYFGLSDENKQTHFRQEFWGKFIPAIATGLTASTALLWFSLDKEKIEITFPANLIYHRASGDVIENVDIKYKTFYGCKPYQIRKYIKIAPEYNPNLGKSYAQLECANNVIFLETLTLLFSAFESPVGGMVHRGWGGSAINPLYKSKIPIGGDVIDPFIYSTFTRIPEKSLKICKFSDSLKSQLSPDVQEIFSQLDEKKVIETLQLNLMYIPKSTIIKINCDRNLPGKEILFHNSFCKVLIYIFRSGGSIGLSRNWQWILGYDEEKSDEFETSENALYISAQFNKLRFGHPLMPKYKDWVNSLIKRLRSCLDSDMHLERCEKINLMYKDEIKHFCKQ
jgi:hypothetical protein